MKSLGPVHSINGFGEDVEIRKFFIYLGSDSNLSLILLLYLTLEFTRKLQDISTSI